MGTTPPLTCGQKYEYLQIEHAYMIWSNIGSSPQEAAWAGFSIIDGFGS